MRAHTADLNHYVYDNEFGDSLQSAYHPLHNTETALLRVKNYIFSSTDDQTAVTLILLDLSAAFDIMNHNIQLQRFEYNQLKLDYGLAAIS